MIAVVIVVGFLLGAALAWCGFSLRDGEWFEAGRFAGLCVALLVFGFLAVYLATLEVHS